MIAFVMSSLMSCDNLAKLKEPKPQASFLHRFPCFKQINRLCRFDGFLGKMFLQYQMHQSMTELIIQFLPYHG